MKLKINLYILSLLLFFALLFINKINVPLCFIEDCKFIGFWKLIKTNWIPIICLIGMIYGYYSFWYFKHKVLDSSKQGPWEITEIENISFENLSFIATYIIPLLSFNLNEERNAFMILLILIVIGFVYIKANLYYTNPSLALLNFRIYRISYRSQNEIKKCIVLTREKLKINDKVFAKHIDENIYYVKKSIYEKRRITGSFIISI
jgi:hypothetical protein